MKIIHQFYYSCKILIFLIITTFFLSACDRHNYVTWHCKGLSANQEQFTMVLDGSIMRLKSGDLKFCGSLGNSSFFDVTCPSSLEKSKILFIQKKGDLIEGMNAFKCSEL